MKIAILGTGGVGGYFGARLAKAGNDVIFLARGEHLAAMRNNGLKVNSFLGDVYLATVNATDQVDEIGEVDLMIVSVKAWQVPGIADEVCKILGSKTVVLPLQNGILAAEELSEKIASDHIIGGLCRIISKIESPGVISHIGVDPLITLGELNNQISERVEKIARIFNEAGIRAQVSSDIYAELWKKFISICAGGILAVTRSTYGEVRELYPVRKMMIDLMKEIFHLSNKVGINIDAGFLDKAVSFIDNFPYEASSSLARDVWDGKPSEIEYQNGTVVRLANKYGLDVPINSFVYYSILPMEKRARGISTYP